MLLLSKMCNEKHIDTFKLVNFTILAILMSIKKQ